MHEQQIFISHSSKDIDFAIKLYEDLLSAGYWVWMDKSLEEIKEWKPQIEYHLRKSNRFIVLISSYSVESKWVRHEGSMAYALNQLIVPLKIEGFGKFSAADLPLWVQEIQLANFIEGAIDHQDQLKKLKQLLGDPLPIQKHLEDMLILYKTSGILLDEVALNLIEKHKNDISWPKGKKALAEELIEKSKRKLQDYWERYDKLEKDYENAKLDNSNLKKNFKIHLAILVILYIALAVYAFVVIYNYFN